ncbi:hypothetical protein THIOKS11310024 [Thiocapsa sp. KS1]|nr:hypothetical protein THIOKS11310024 [Thiocapsa sp. KS1]
MPWSAPSVRIHSGRRGRSWSRPSGRPPRADLRSVAGNRSRDGRAYRPGMRASGYPERRKDRKCAHKPARTERLGDRTAPAEVGTAVGLAALWRGASIDMLLSSARLTTPSKSKA